VLYWRERTGDGIYDLGGNLIRGDGGLPRALHRHPG
jgi:hypothetical protein